MYRKHYYSGCEKMQKKEELLCMRPNNFKEMMDDATDKYTYKFNFCVKTVCR